ncbi:MAG: acyl carrier protein [Ruminococcus sp.]|nr:acyl carrier protein [Ruminococcus sp.]MDE7097579.1 acyl carrier protein [Ruminococcus sp.]
MENLTWEAFVQCISDYVGVDADEIREETDIFEDLCVDSLGLFGLGTYITETFKVNIPLSSVASIYKIGDMFSLLKKEGTPIE